MQIIKDIYLRNKLYFDAYTRFKELPNNAALFYKSKHNIDKLYIDKLYIYNNKIYRSRNWAGIESTSIVELYE